MAFADEQLHTILYRLPGADGDISIFNAGHVLWAYTWAENAQSSTGDLTPTGALTLRLELTKALSGSLTPSGGLVKKTSIPLSGVITPSGIVASITSYFRVLSGSLTPSGAIVLKTSKALSGSLTPAGALALRLELTKALDGTLIPAGDIIKATSKSVGGTLTPTGDLVSIVTFVVELDGSLTLAGAIAAANPAWLLIDNTLTWQGEWDETRSYALNDAVLYKSDDGNEWHVFVSKISHSAGNIPTSSSSAWRRYYQEIWL